MASTNDKMIAWIGERLRYGTRPEAAWNGLSRDWIESEPHGDDAPPDVVLTEIKFRLSKLGDTYVGPGAQK